MSAPLSHRQKRYLSELSNRAFDRLAADADGSAFYDGLSPTAARQAFRHDQTVLACGKAGLRCCSQDDYKLVEANLLEILGFHGRALNALIAAETQPRRQAEAVLVRECRRFGFDLGYPAAICQIQYRIPLADASPRQIWNLVYTVRNRGTRRAAEKHE